MQQRFLYLFAVLDWATRHVLAWRLSNSLTSDFCIDAVEEAISRYGCPQIFNTDQGCQFTDIDFVGMLEANRIAVSMDGKGPGATTCSLSALGYDQVRGGLPSCVRVSPRSQRFYRTVYCVLQLEASASGTR